MPKGGRRRDVPKAGKTQASVIRSPERAMENCARAGSGMPALPKLIAFDLDGTLWWPEMYMLAGPPFKMVGRDERGREVQSGRAVADRRGEVVQLMGASHDILHELVTSERWRGSEVAYISRCDCPPWADKCLSLFQAAPGVSMKQAAVYSEIYYGTKTKHFRAVHKASGIPYRDMLFFDNEMRNCRDVTTLGVNCIYTPDGMTAQNWQEGLRKFAKAAAQRPGSHQDSNRKSSPVASDREDGDEWGGYW